MNLRRWQVNCSFISCLNRQRIDTPRCLFSITSDGVVKQIFNKSLFCTLVNMATSTTYDRQQVLEI